MWNDTDNLFKRINNLNLEIDICDILMNRSWSFDSTQAVLSEDTKQRLNRLRDYFTEISKSGNEVRCEYQYDNDSDS